MPARKPGRPRKTAHRKPGKFEEQNTPVDPVQEFQENPEDLLREILGEENCNVESINGGEITFTGTDLDNVSPALLEKLHIDSRVTPLKICALFPRCRFQERTIRNIMTDAGLFAIKGEGYELIPAITVLLLHFQRLAEGKKREVHPDTAR